MRDGENCLRFRPAYLEPQHQRVPTRRELQRIVAWAGTVLTCDHARAGHHLARCITGLDRPGYATETSARVRAAASPAGSEDASITVCAGAAPSEDPQGNEDSQR